jgi:hypothetical protein
MAKTVTEARLLVAYGKHREGETIRGDLAAKLVAEGMAQDTSPKVKAPKGKTKNAGAAPENKGDGFEV